MDDDASQQPGAKRTRGVDAGEATSVSVCTPCLPSLFFLTLLIFFNITLIQQQVAVEEARAIAQLHAVHAQKAQKALAQQATLQPQVAQKATLQPQVAQQDDQALSDRVAKEEAAAAGHGLSLSLPLSLSFHSYPSI